VLKKLNPTHIAKPNTDDSTFMKVRNNLTKRTSVSTGIRQRDSLGSIMFNIMKKAKDAGRGYSTGDKEVKIVCYADDALIISKNKDKCWN